MLREGHKEQIKTLRVVKIYKIVYHRKPKSEIGKTDAIPSYLSSFALLMRKYFKAVLDYNKRQILFKVVKKY